MKGRTTVHGGSEEQREGGRVGDKTTTAVLATFPVGVTKMLRQKSLKR